MSSMLRALWTSDVVNLIIAVLHSREVSSQGKTKAADTWHGAIMAGEVGEACYAVLV